MSLPVEELLRDNPALLLFTIVWMGYLAGKLRVFGIELGASLGVLGVSLAMGHLGFDLPEVIGTIGFVFFIYSVGYQAGPRFFASFRDEGRKYVQLSLVVVATAVALTFVFDAVFGFSPGYAAGVLAGALTSTPTLAAARDGVAVTVSGSSAEAVSGDVKAIRSNLTVAYAITYLYGLLGLAFMIQLLPRLLRVDLAEEAARYAREKGIGADEREPTLPQLRFYVLDRQETAGKTLTDLLFLQETGCVIVRILRNGAVIDVGPATALEMGDELAVIGSREDQLRAALVLGSEGLCEAFADLRVAVRNVLLTSPAVDGVTARDVGFTNDHHCMLLSATRGAVQLPVSLDLVLQRGDMVEVAGDTASLDALTPRIGKAERPVYETDLFTFAFGICVGIVVGSSSLDLGVPIGIGLAGGLLAAGLAVGFLRASNPLIGNVPQAARYIVMELGLLFFMADVGISAGGELVAALRDAGGAIVLSGVFVTTLPTLAALCYGRWVLKMNAALLFGAVAGGLTSTPALGVVTRAARSNVPALGYAGVYAFAVITLTVVGQLMIRFG
ncbi:MAG: TrkA C-terminal domain-containing protein [Myxococcota bacterium]|nr:TrkA C-terminal domain-containing protein [Myxococcota bacterium]